MIIYKTSPLLLHYSSVNTLFPIWKWHFYPPEIERIFPSHFIYSLPLSNLMKQPSTPSDVCLFLYQTFPPPLINTFHYQLEHHQCYYTWSNYYLFLPKYQSQFNPLSHPKTASFPTTFPSHNTLFWTTSILTGRYLERTGDS